MSKQQPKFGLLLPHFGRNATRDNVVNAAVIIEDAGFDSVWVRDHIVYRPHGHESPDPTFWEPLVTLGAVAGCTEGLVLGTGALIPYRHPLQTALAMATLERIAGPGRVILGIGLGSFDHEFEAVGMGGWDRRKVVREQVEIFRRAWTGETIDHAGEYYAFSDLQVHPTPIDRDLPIWYSGTSQAAARRAVEYCQGWIPGRMPRRDIRKRVDRMRRLSEEADKPMPAVGAIPYVSVSSTMEEAMQGINISQVAAELAPRFTLPESGGWNTMEDMDGAIIAGTPELVLHEVRETIQAGVEHFVFDLRLQFDSWRDKVSQLAEEVLPQLKQTESSGREAGAS